MITLDALFQDSYSPLQTVEQEVFVQHGLRLLVKRDDLLHPTIAGNKWRKLKHNLLEAHRLGHNRLITFGGAYSNHLAATAAAGAAFGFSTVGVVSGEENRHDARNPTLSFAQECGMELVFTSRASMRGKSHTSLLQALKIDSSDAYILPQGGANCLALLGCREIVAETTAQLGYVPDFFITACGTGTTLAGIASGLGGSGTALGISVLKGDFMEMEVKKMLAACGEMNVSNWQVNLDFHFGGYVKFTPALIDFINHFKEQSGISLDPIYTGKSFYAAFELARQGFFPAGASIVLVHTGGLQGIDGFNARFGPLIE